MIYFIGDPHSRFGRVTEIVKRDRPDAVIFLGDLELLVPREHDLERLFDLADCWYIHGNHDTDSAERWKNLASSTLAGRNLHGRVQVIDGRRVAGLGGIFRGKVWRPPETPSFISRTELVERLRQGRGRAWNRSSQLDSDHVASNQELTHCSSIFPADYDALFMDGRHADFLVTHEAPSCHPHGFEAIDLLAQSLQVKRAFHGHHHDNLDYRSYWQSMGFEVYGVGLRGVTDEFGRVICPGELDDERQDRLARGDRDPDVR